MAAKTKVAVVSPPEVVDLPFWHELFAGVDYVRLKASAVYYGFGVPRGNGTPVVVVPGFMGADFYLLEMYWWLKRIGYVPYLSRIGHNAKCPDILSHKLQVTVNRAFAETGQPVHLIGHSFGGVLARGVACRKPERIASVTMLGSPFAGTRVSPWIMRMIQQVQKYTQKEHGRNKDCYSMDCHCGFVSTMRGNFPDFVPETAIYTKEDGVVDWEACMTGNPADNIEVYGTHCGLAWNPKVYRTIARRLHAANEKITMRRIDGTIADPPISLAEANALKAERTRPRPLHTLPKRRAKHRRIAAAAGASRNTRGPNNAAA